MPATLVLDLRNSRIQAMYAPEGKPFSTVFQKPDCMKIRGVGENFEIDFASETENDTHEWKIFLNSFQLADGLDFRADLRPLFHALVEFLVASAVPTDREDRLNLYYVLPLNASENVGSMVPWAPFRVGCIDVCPCDCIDEGFMWSITVGRLLSVKKHQKPVDVRLCTYINGKPAVLSFLFEPGATHTICLEGIESVEDLCYTTDESHILKAFVGGDFEQNELPDIRTFASHMFRIGCGKTDLFKIKDAVTPRALTALLSPLFARDTRAFEIRRKLFVGIAGTDTTAVVGPKCTEEIPARFVIPFEIGTEDAYGAVLVFAGQCANPEYCWRSVPINIYPAVHGSKFSTHLHFSDFYSGTLEMKALSPCCRNPEDKREFIMPGLIGQPRRKGFACI